jgi:hypothetical protein
MPRPPDLVVISPVKDWTCAVTSDHRAKAGGDSAELGN